MGSSLLDASENSTQAEILLLSFFLSSHSGSEEPTKGGGEMSLQQNKAGRNLGTAEAKGNNVSLSPFFGKMLNGKRGYNEAKNCHEDKEGPN